MFLSRFDTRKSRCYAGAVLASPVLHGASGLWDEAILVIEGIVVVALVIAYIRGRKRPKQPPAEPPADTPGEIV
ncbi:MAG: hypothetical protein HZB53_05445 [Chloroflexi bacterium]|nr:hypothetical protein [Chloroflexota bacterium]